jgi:dUTP pyrophosphatase
MSKLLIKPNDTVKHFYENHSTFHEGDSGLDLFCPIDVSFVPGETKVIDLCIQSEMLCNDKNVSYYMYPRSSLSKTPLCLANSVGIIDAGYRGNLKIALKYVPTTEFLIELVSGLLLPTEVCSKHTFTFNKGDRVAQLCSADLSTFTFTLVDELSTSTRGDGGFGSTGK